MPAPHVTFPPLPAETARAAEAAFGRGNFYLTIGDQVDLLFADLDLAQLFYPGQQPGFLVPLLCLVTVFQYVEDLPDRQAVEAVRTRIDWKYALHLLLDFPGIHHAALCEFRQHLLFNPAGQQVFQQLLARLESLGVIGKTGRRSLEVAQVLAAVCTISRVERVAEAMRQAMESLAACEPEWLRTIALPHWYERYNRARPALHLPRAKGEQAALAQAIGSDIQHLLEAIAKSGTPAADQLPEVQALRQVWHQQFEQHEGKGRWRTSGCAFCGESGASPNGHHLYSRVG